MSLAAFWSSVGFKATVLYNRLRLFVNRDASGFDPSALATMRTSRLCGWLRSSWSPHHLEEKIVERVHHPPVGILDSVTGKRVPFEEYRAAAT